LLHLVGINSLEGVINFDTLLHLVGYSHTNRI